MLASMRIPDDSPKTAGTPAGWPDIDRPEECLYHNIVKPGTYQEIISRISDSKNAELVRSAKLPFSQKLALTAAASRNADQLMLSESFAEPVLEIIKLFNHALKQRVFERYALAGGLAVEYYGAPINTVDADFLVVFPETMAGLLDPSSLFEFFRRRGAIAAGEYLVLHGMKFQMIPANSPLDAEALQMAASVSEKDIPFFVVTLEHLIALKLGAWRYKDRLHINHLLDSGVALDKARLSPILERHRLEGRWRQLLAERAG